MGQPARRALPAPGPAGHAGPASPGGPAGHAAFALFADARMPTGGHAHSGGVEQAVAAGTVRDAGDLEAFLTGRLATTGRADAALAAAARARCPGGPWEPVDAEAAARCAGPALRGVARAQGKRLLRLGRSAWDQPWLEGLAAATAGAPMWPVALGAVGAAAGLDGPQVAAAAATASVTGPGWAAVRALGLDPFEVARLLAGLAPAVDALAAAAARDAARLPLGELPAAGPPLLELGAEDHARWEVRLFAS
jgi:urease accessory protein